MEHPHAPRIGDPAPDFSALSTAGEIRLSTWQEDAWVVLFAYPAAFTPVAVTELSALAKHQKSCCERNIRFLGLSSDTHTALLAWIRDLAVRFKARIEFPLISDNQLDIARSYGMIHPGASTRLPVRSTFIIDPKRTVRAILHYPLANGRSIDELLRLVDAIIAADEAQAATPADWLPGQAMLEAPPTKSAEAIFETPEAGCDFYLKQRG